MKIQYKKSDLPKWTQQQQFAQESYLFIYKSFFFSILNSISASNLLLI